MTGHYYKRIDEFCTKELLRCRITSEPDYMSQFSFLIRNPFGLHCGHNESYFSITLESNLERKLGADNIIIFKLPNNKCKILLLEAKLIRASKFLVDNKIKNKNISRMGHQAKKLEKISKFAYTFFMFINDYSYKNIKLGPSNNKFYKFSELYPSCLISNVFDLKKRKVFDSVLRMTRHDYKRISWLASDIEEVVDFITKDNSKNLTYSDDTINLDTLSIPVASNELLELIVSNPNEEDRFDSSIENGKIENKEKLQVLEEFKLIIDFMKKHGFKNYIVIK